MANPPVIPKEIPPKGLPELPEGMVWHQYPPAPEFIEDPVWYDTLGRDKLAQLGIFDGPPSSGQVDQIRQLLREHPSRGLYMMSQAAVKGKEEIIRALLDSGVKAHPEPDTEDDTSLPAIHAAAYNGHLNCVKLLIEQGRISTNTVDEMGGTPLMRAASESADAFSKTAHNHLPLVRYLLEIHKPDIHPGNGLYANGPTAPFIATLRGHANVVKTLLRHGGPVEHIDATGPPVSYPAKLVVTATKGHRATVRLIWEGNAQALKGRDDKVVMLEMSREDMEWFSKVEYRKKDHELLEDGSGRELRSPKQRM